MIEQRVNPSGLRAVLRELKGCKRMGTWHLPFGRYGSVFLVFLTVGRWERGVSQVTAS